MLNFDSVQFKGVFRNYQQRVLDNADKHLNDGKINIVAAPGSGKTVLGLELIRRLASPCMIFSPTTAIRQQWGERFKDMFLNDPQDFGLLFSNDLRNVKLVNSVTYQALYSAIEKAMPEDGDNYADVDIFKTIKDFGIKTICLDEAHHLKNEWQRALEKFISALDRNIKIISLTATPPYDAEGNEWNRYTSICGEIDEEIFVPELVGQNTLCPHQDYVFFNYPTEAEEQSFNDYKKSAAEAVNAIGKLDLINKVYTALNGEKDYETLFSAAKEYISLATLLTFYGYELNKKLIKEITAKKGLPKYKISHAQTALSFLLDGEILSEEEKEEIIFLLKSHGVYERKKVCLELNNKLKRTLISSVGKLQSIRRIAACEATAMGNDLRMLVLTDYIKKEALDRITVTEEFNSINVVSIFETLRRADLKVNMGVLSGTLVILPKSVDLSHVKHKKEDIPGTNYCTVDFPGGTYHSVSLVGRLFEQGKIQILIGTKSLLGEGWDSPCINSLILASFVGSFVLSNQMRGRAIRIDKSNPEKSSNIWHLVTVEPEYMFKEKATDRISAYLKEDYKELSSYDYAVLRRRFDSFMGPHYTTGTIESGIERISLIKPPFDKNGIEYINEKMLELSKKRDEVQSRWKGEVCNGSFAVCVESQMSKDLKIPVFTFTNALLASMIFLVETILIQLTIRLFANKDIIGSISTLAAMILLLVFVGDGIKRFIIHVNPANSIKVLGKAVYKTLAECGLISSSAKVEVNENKQMLAVSMRLRNATIHDQNVFNDAVTEMLSPIENPRYLLIAKNIFKKYNYKLSFACPSAIGKKKEYVEVLAKHLKLAARGFEPVFTHCESGRRLILKCRKKSYITANYKQMNKKYRVSHWN